MQQSHLRLEVRGVSRILSGNDWNVRQPIKL